MKKLFTWLLLALSCSAHAAGFIDGVQSTAAGGAGVAPTFVQKICVTDGADSTNVNLTFAGNVTNGNLLVVAAFVRGNNVGDSLSTASVFQLGGTSTIGTVTADKLDVNHNSGDSRAVGIWSAPITGTGDLNMFIDMNAWASSSMARNACFMEFSLTNVGGSRVNAVNSANQNATTAPNTGNAASGGAGLYVAVVDALNGGDPTEVGTFTLAAEGTNNGSVIYKLVSSSSTTAGSWTVTSTDTSSAVVAYKAATP